MKSNPKIANYFVADIISQIGSNIPFLSLNWYILETTKSNAKIGIAVFLGVVAGLLTCPLGGVISDIFSIKN